MSSQNELTFHYTEKRFNGARYTADDWQAGAIPLKEIAEERGITTEQALQLVIDWGLIPARQAGRIRTIKGKAYGLAIDQTASRMMELEADCIKEAAHPARYIKQTIARLQKILDLHPELMETIYLTGGHQAINYHGVRPETVRKVTENESAGRVDIIDLWDWDYASGEPVHNKAYELAVKFQLIQKLESWLDTSTTHPKPSPAPGKSPGRNPDYPDQRKFVKGYWSDSEKKKALKDEYGNPHAISKGLHRIIKSEIAKQRDRFSNSKPASIDTIKGWIDLK
jgi:hypothetical protein